MRKHVTRDGQELSLSEIEDAHLLNIIKYNNRLANSGLEVAYGGIGSTAEECWADIDVLYGKHALKELCHEEYVSEAKKRGLEWT